MIESITTPTSTNSPATPHRPPARGMRLSRLAAVAVLLVLSVGTVFGLGTAEVTTPAPVQETYPAEQQLELSRSVQLSVGGGFFDRSYTLGFSSGQSGDPENRRLVAPNGSSIPYRIVDSAASGTDLKDLGDQPSQSEVLTGVIPAGQTVTEQFVVLIPGGGVPEAGTYSDSVELTVYDNQERVADTVTLELGVTVPALLGISLVPAGAAFDPDARSYLLDFGVLEQGDIGMVDLIVRSNIAYGVELSSANTGAFAHTDPGITSLVPYTLRFDGSPTDLSGGSAGAAVGMSPPPASGRRHALEIEVGETAAAASGPHEDTVQITVIAQ